MMTTRCFETIICYLMKQWNVATCNVYLSFIYFHNAITDCCLKSHFKWARAKNARIKNILLPRVFRARDARTVIMNLHATDMKKINILYYRCFAVRFSDSNITRHLWAAYRLGRDLKISNCTILCRLRWAASCRHSNRTMTSLAPVGRRRLASTTWRQSRAVTMLARYATPRSDLKITKTRLFLFIDWSSYATT